MNDAAIRELARHAGIAVQWIDHANKRHRVPIDTIRRILAALGLPCETDDELSHSRHLLDGRRTPPLITATAGQPVDLPIQAVAGSPRAQLIHEDGNATALEVRQSGGGVSLSGIQATGYHTIEIGRTRLTIAVAPARCITIDDIAPGERLAGLAAQIYGLRSAGDCGIGDMSGVTAFARAAAALKVDALALSPAHALFAADLAHCSPYSPSSRLFYNPLLADAASVFGAVRMANARTNATSGISERALEASALIDWPDSSRAKMAILRRLFDDFVAVELTASPATGLAADFTKFRAARGAALEQHALFETLHAARLQVEPQVWNWRDWPSQWRDPRSATVRTFAEENQHEISYHIFLQWIADRSFAVAQRDAKRSAMRIGIIADLAVGMNSGGSHAWSHQDDILCGLEIGAPPDLFNARGQNWGLTTFSPRALCDRGFAPFIATLCACMRHAGGVRIDHAMGLMRLWVTPHGAKPSEGAYLAYPLDDLFRLTALESQRHRAIVIGEDLGTVPAGFRNRLSSAGIYGMNVLWFERGGSDFKPPGQWPAEAVAMTSTHDLPTVAGWWRGSDLAVRAKYGLVKDAEREQASRRADRHALWEIFKRTKAADGELPAANDASRVADAAVEFIAETPSRLALLPLEDVLAVEDQPNLPGTVDGHPNWRRRYAGEAGALLDAPDARHRVETLTKRGRAMSAPRATMRLQFHRGFTFSDARSLSEYFASLGISHVYASPIMTARTGSLHGYDVIDPTRINPELGGEDELRRLVEELRRYELGLIVDIVPNHMAIGCGNAWWMDVLARGRGSRYAKYFDIDWNPPNPDLRDKILLPVLGRPYGEAIEAGEITLARDDDHSTFVIRYFEHVFPVAGNEVLADPAIADFDPATPAGRTRLHNLLERQHYRLSWWRMANDEINWRRFFDINELAAVRVEDDEVFEAVHATPFRLYAEGLIDGVRVDHIDGLSQPDHYCRKLRQRLHALEKKRPHHAPDGPAYVVVEKILARNERLPAEWQMDGTTGYDFMDEVSALQHDAAGERPLRELWHRVSGRPGDFDTEEQLARRQILERSFSAQRDAVVETLHAIAQSSLTTRDYSRAAIRRCLTEVLAHFPVYRVYARIDHASPTDRAFVAQAVVRARATCFPADAWLVTKLGDWLSGMRIDPAVDCLQDVALARFQQLSAPLCAKAVEDTAFYRYGRLISRNDVGFDVRQFACPAAEFHRKMQARAAELPRAMLATATHDHKRGEDVRARLAVLSELSDDWTRAVERWIALSAPHCAIAGGAPMPGAGDLAILFQTIVGAWPLSLIPSDPPALTAYSKRVAAWQQKALREAKLHSDWAAPNETYERATSDFITWLFSGPSELLNEIASFAQRIGPAGAANGLAQVLVKLTAPGVPDIYQGTEYWDLSLVDPDNRSPVDFAVRQGTLAAPSVADSAAHWGDGRIKQLTVARVLALRKKMPRLFSDGSYLPLETAGPLANYIVAFARTWRDSAAIVIFCRFTTQLTKGDDWRAMPLLHCKNTTVCIPPVLRGIFSDALTSNRTLSIGADIEVRQVLNRLPIAVMAK